MWRNQGDGRPLASCRSPDKNAPGGDEDAEIVKMNARRKAVAMVERPIVCTLTPDDRAARREALLPGLVQQAEHIERTYDAYRLRFAPSSSILQRLIAVIDEERQCCQFLRFDITVEHAQGPIWLTLSGPRGTVDMLETLFA